MRRSLAIMLALLVAGCAAPAVDLEAASVVAAAGSAVVRHDSTGFLPLDPSVVPLAMRLAKTGFLSTEPTVGVTSSGAIFTVAGDSRIGRSTDGGLTWEVVGNPVTGAKRTFDPWVHVDPRTDRVLNLQLYVACSSLEWSDDDGATWGLNLLGGCGFPGHDYQKLTSGPPADGVATEDYDSVLYYVYAAGTDPAAPTEGGNTCVSRSLDGGRSFDLPVCPHPARGCGTFGAPIAVAPDGVAYSARPRCDGVDVARSRDSGATWEPVASVPYAEVGGFPYADANVAIDEDGRLLMTFVDNELPLGFVTSLDEGETWSAPRRLTPPGVDAAAFAVNAGGASGRFVVAYLGAASDPSTWPSTDPSEAPEDTVWHLHVATTDDAFADDPVWTTTRVTPEDDPVQVGCVWLRGGSNPCRNLGDFIHLVLHEGRPYVAFTDGCDRCTRADDSRARDVVVAIPEGGPVLTDALSVPPRAPTARTGSLAVGVR